jgi:hypothetical protein
MTPNHVEWKNVCMMAILVTGLCYCIDDILSYIAPSSITGQDLVNAINAIGGWIVLIAIIGFGAKWALDFITSKIFGAKNGTKDGGENVSPK